jgi:hypothetical protein
MSSPNTETGVQGCMFENAYRTVILGINIWRQFGIHYSKIIKSVTNIM